MTEQRSNNRKVRASFRDPSGFLFFRDGVLYRQVNAVYREHYDHLMDSGLYEDLTGSGLLVPHEEADAGCAQTAHAYKVLKPKWIPFISYPYEWCFSQLKDAALTTLAIQKRAFEFGMVLKDSSAYNIQFVEGRPVLIDTLSFEKYREGAPWVAYRQFCQHFLAPLALARHTDVRLSQLLRVYIDGIPLDLASSLLPFGTRFRFGLLSHIHLHARCQTRYADKPVKGKAKIAGKKMGRLGFLGLMDSLESAVGKLDWRPRGTEWGEYYEDTNYSPDALAHKKAVVGEFLDAAGPESVWDLGANVGLFSRIASEKGIPTVAFDIDPAAVEKNYRDCVRAGEKRLLPLLLDLTNPSPGIGWCNEERASLAERGPADAVLALALVHHLAISNNVPLGGIAEFLRRIGNWLIIEFVPKSDSQVQRLLATREDIFSDYTPDAFEREFSRYFTIEQSAQVKDSERVLYLMRGEGSNG